MKKRVKRKSVIAVFTALICVIMICALPVLQCQAKVITYLNGDADGDSDVSIIDATVVQRLLAELCEDRDGMIAVRADVNRNDLDIDDVTIIQRFLAEIPVPAVLGIEMKWIIKGDSELPEIDA